MANDQSPLNSNCNFHDDCERRLLALERRVGEGETKSAEFWRVDWGALQQKIGQIDSKIEILTHRVTESQGKFTLMHEEIAAVERRIQATVDGLCKTVEVSRIAEAAAREALERRLGTMEQRWWKVTGGWAVLCVVTVAVIQMIEPKAAVHFDVNDPPVHPNYLGYPPQSLSQSPPPGYTFQLTPLVATPPSYPSNPPHR